MGVAEFSDPVGAFVPHGRVERQPTQAGPLTGLRVAVKDLFDWQGVPTGAGNPDWLTTHPVPFEDSEVLSIVTGAGAVLRGKTITDELAYSIHGDNVHYGTPFNTAAPGRVPGGSSSGSAAAVASGLVEVALGTDTGGSVRVPAAYCGVYGLRTTHGVVSRRGLVPLSSTFDTVGWFASTPHHLALMAAALVPSSVKFAWKTLWSLPEAEALADAPTLAALSRMKERMGLSIGDLGPLVDEFGGLEELRKAYVTLQAFEAWQCHGAWIQSAKPHFGPSVAQRFSIAAQVTADQADAARSTMRAFRSGLRDRLGEGGLVLLPSTPGPAPKMDETAPVVDQIRVKTMRLTCLAGLAGLPQLNLPVLGPDGLPRGVGLMGPAGSDLALCGWAVRAQGV